MIGAIPEEDLEHVQACHEIFFRFPYKNRLILSCERWGTADTGTGSHWSHVLKEQSSHAPETYHCENVCSEIADCLEII